MKIKITIVLIISMLLQFGSIANANVFNYGNVTITLPESVLIMGSESGTEIRICTIKGSVDAAPGTTIPLRASFQAILIDSLLTRLNSAYVEATVEGLTHLDLIFRNNCSAQPGTVKPPYRWGGIVSRIPTDKPGFDAPANVNFVSSTYLPTPTPTPTPTPAPTPAPTPTPTPTPTISKDTKNPDGSNNVAITELNKIRSNYENLLVLRPDLELKIKKALFDLNLVNNEINITEGATMVKVMQTLNRTYQGLLKSKKGKYSISCLKGKAKKIVSGINPKCPTGYRKA